MARCQCGPTRFLFLFVHHLSSICHDWACPHRGPPVLPEGFFHFEPESLWRRRWLVSCPFFLEAFLCSWPAGPGQSTGCRAHVLRPGPLHIHTRDDSRCQAMKLCGRLGLELPMLIQQTFIYFRSFWLLSVISHLSPSIYRCDHPCGTSLSPRSRMPPPRESIISRYRRSYVLIFYPGGNVA